MNNSKKLEELFGGKMNGAFGSRRALDVLLSAYASTWDNDVRLQ